MTDICQAGKVDDIECFHPFSLSIVKSFKYAKLPTTWYLDSVFDSIFNNIFLSLFYEVLFYTLCVKSH